MNRVWIFSALSAASAFFLSCILSPLVSGAAKKRGIVSDPGKVRFYTSQTPLLGHLVLFFSFFSLLAGAFAFGLFSDDFIYTLSDLQRITTGIFFASLFLAISATYSDVRNESGDFEWLYIIGSAFLIYFFDIRFIVLKIPGMGDINLYIWGLPLLVVWILLIVSIIELLDFFEGLASCVVAVVSVVYFYLHASAGKGELFVPFFFATLGGAAAGLVPHQLFRRKILYGKAGNKLVGFLFAAGTVISHRKETTGQFLIFPIAVILFFIVAVNYLFLERQLRPLVGPVEKEKKK